MLFYGDCFMKCYNINVDQKKHDVNLSVACSGIFMCWRMSWVGLALMGLRIPNCFSNTPHTAAPTTTVAPEAFVWIIEVQLFMSRGKVTEYLSGTRTS